MTVVIFAGSLFIGEGFHLWRVLAIYLAAVLSSIIAIILKNYKEEYHPLKINLIQMLLTGIIVTLFSLLTEDIRSNRWSSQAVG